MTTKPHRSSLGALIESFFIQRLQRQQQASPATVAAYKDALRLLLCFAASRLGKHVDALDIQDLGYSLVLAFLDFLESERGNSARTRNARLAALHAFYRHVAYSRPEALALAQRVLAIAPKRTVKRVVQFLQPPEVNALLAAPDRRSFIGQRDHALLLFLLRTGARVSEAVGVNTQDLTLTAPRQVRIRGKGSKERILPLTKDLATILRDLLEKHQQSALATGPVFVDARGKRLTRFGVTHIVRRARSKAMKECISLGSHPISPHSFRHTAAMRLLQSGVDLAVIRAWLGHVDIQTTHEYLEADIEMKRQALARANVTSEVPIRCEPPSAILALLEN
jgi:site-specific recombinase XerD